MERERRLDLRAAAALFLVALSAYLFTASGLPDNPDAEVEFQTTRSLARSGTFALEGTSEAAAIVERRFDVAPGVDGQWYSWFGVGQALAAVPLYWIGSRLGAAAPRIEAEHARSQAFGVARSEYAAHLLVGFRNPIWGAWIVALVFASARWLGAHRRAAFGAALAMGAATFLWPQARSTLSDVQATALFATAFSAWLALRTERKRVNGPRYVWPLLAGITLGAAVLTRVALAPAAAILASAVAWELARARHGRARAALALCAPLALAAALFCATNAARFGSPFETGYGHALREGTFFSYPPLLGIAGLIAAPGKGILWHAPWLVLAPVGLALAWQCGARDVALVVVAVVLAVVLPVAPTQTWHGAYTYGPRYLLPCVPLVAPLVPLAWTRARRARWWRVALLPLVALGAVSALAGVVTDHMTHQDLAAQAARIAWPEPGGRDEREADEARFLLIQWDWRFAAPWAHWRIFAARVAGRGEEFSAGELFGLEGDASFSPQGERERGFRHLWWVDLSQRLGGPVWPAFLVPFLCLAVGLWLARGTLARPK